MITTHYCVKSDGRVLVELKDVILCLYKAKDNNNMNIEQIINIYEDLAEKARKTDIEI